MPVSKVGSMSTKLGRTPLSNAAEFGYDLGSSFKAVGAAGGVERRPKVSQEMDDEDTSGDQRIRDSANSRVL